MNDDEKEAHYYRADNNSSNNVQSSTNESSVPSHWVMKNQRLIEFKNPFKGFKYPSTGDVIKFQREMVKNKQVIPSDDELPQYKPNMDLLNSPDMKSLQGDTPQVTWIGHSTFLIQFRGVNILTDAVFSDRCSPLQFMGPKRIKPLPIEIENLPTIHFVIISHNHYDHLDFYALTKIQQYHDPVILLPFRMKYSWMEKFYQEKNNAELAKLKLIELDWWKSTNFNISMSSKKGEEKIESNLQFTFLPAQHWGLRTGMDRNEALWGSWGCTFLYKDTESTETTSENIKSYKMWFAGDTGYSQECFTEIGEKFGPIDLSFIPIGAYEPRWMMKYQHVDPEEAVQIALDIKSKKQISMHWGTFILTTEPIVQPKKDLEDNLKKRGLDDSFFVTMAHGNTIFPNAHSSTTASSSTPTANINCEPPNPSVQIL